MFSLAKKYFGAYKKELIIGPAAKFTDAVFELIVPLLMAQIIDTGITAGGGKGYIYGKGAVILVLGIAGYGLSLLCQYLASKASQGIGTDIRNDLFRHINSLSYSDLDDFGTSTLVTRLTNDINQIQLAVAMLIRLVMRAPFLIIGAVIMSVRIDLKLSVIFLITMPLVSLVLYLVMFRTIPFFKVIQKKMDVINLRTHESLTGVRVIRAFAKRDTEKKRFDEANDDYAQTSFKAAKLSSLLNPLNYCILNLAIAAIIWYGGIRADNGFLTQGQIIAFVNYMTQISHSLVVVAHLVVIFTKASASADRINEALNRQPSVTNGNSCCIPIKEEQPAIEFRNVFFSYGNNSGYALSDVDFSVKRGSTVGIIGGTGDGKTTLVNLIPRFYDCTGGSVLIDGVNVKDYTFGNLRAWIGVVPQQTFLFSGSIYDNVSLGNQNASEEDVINALITAQAYEFVMKMPDGINTCLDQGGKNLSGGQKQRLAIARALCSKPRILILDDSMSALDFSTEAKLRQGIRKIAEVDEITVLIISQRISSIKYADKIIVMDDGCVVGNGIHDELINTCAVYNEIYLSQNNTQGEGNAS